MSKTIRIPAELYIRLERHAKGFDSPATVIERVLNAYEGVSPQELSSSAETSEKSKRDKTKYIFEGSQYGKGRFVLAAITKYVGDNPATNFNDLQSVFPKSMQGPIGVFNKVEFVEEKYSGKPIKRHYVMPEEIIQLTDCEVAVCTEWGIGNINDFVSKITEFGYEVIPVED